MNRMLITSIVAVLLIMGAGSSFDNKAFYIPFLSNHLYNPDLDESLDPDNSTDFNGSDY